MTFTGPVQIPVAFNFRLAPDADETYLEDAVKAIGIFLSDEARSKMGYSEQDESDSE